MGSHNNEPLEVVVEEAPVETGQRHTIIKLIVEVRLVGSEEREKCEKECDADAQHRLETEDDVHYPRTTHQVVMNRFEGQNRSLPIGR